MMNGSADISNGFGSAFGLMPAVLLVLYIVGVLLAAQFVAPWLAKSELLTSVAGRFVESIEYAVKGFAASAVLAVAALPVYFLANADGGTRGIALKAITIIAAAYVSFVIIGWLADRAVTAFIDAHPEVNEWGDLFPEEEPDNA
jgi:uncharacterized protein with PQ loop repeat